jgi:hypothetical protein
VRLLRLIAPVVVCLALAACESQPVDRTLGARCAAVADCDVTCLGPSTAYPGGMCTTGCSTDDDCPAGARCAAEAGGVCLFACRDDSDCEFLDDGAGAWQCHPRDAITAGQQIDVCRGGDE